MTWLWIFSGIVLVFGFVVFRGAPYVPSHRKYVRLALTKLYALSPSDNLVDLGSGDGLVLRIATEHGARATGYELNPVLVLLSRILARGDEKQQTYLADMWLVEIPKDATIIYVFAVTRDVGKLTKKLQKHVDQHQKPLWCITYGAGLGNKEPVKTLHAHSLYHFEPKSAHETLQSKQA